MAKAVSINRSKIHEGTIQNLAGENASVFDESGKKLFSTIRELLTFSALLGVHHSLRIPLDKSAGVDDIQGSIYDDTEALEFIWLIGIIETENVDVLKDGNERDCALIFEEYANGGLQLISEWLAKDLKLPSFETLIKNVSSLIARTKV